MATPIPINRTSFNADAIAQTVGARQPGATVPATTSVSIDSRLVTPGALFIALRAVRDGHDFLAAAAQGGASAAIVERGRSHPALSCFEVDDTLVALGALARAHLARVRRAQSLPTIAVGGAAGKTTTKELTAAIIRAVCGETLATPGNLNNLIGVPMTIFMIDERHRAAVIECGTNQRGEIARLADIVRPDAALVLNVDIEHTEGLGSLAGVADEEAGLFVTAGRAVVSTEEDLLLARVPPDKSRLTFGVSAAADVRVAQRTVTGAGRQRVTLKLRADLVESGTDARLEVTLSLLGATAALNAAAALAAVCAAIMRPLRRNELTAITAALEAVRPVDGRMRLRDCGAIVVIDDTYNSNPRSLRAALTAARETADGLNTRLIVAIGDMLELGDLSAEMHRAALIDIVAARPDATILVGPEFAVARSSSRKDFAHAQIFSDSREAAHAIARRARPGDVLLVKGSRGIAMERVIEGLLSVKPGA